MSENKEIGIRALLTHINGKCDILRGEISELKPFQEDLELYGLNVQIL